MATKSLFLIAAAIACLLLSPDALGQKFSFGIAGGASLTGDFRNAAIGTRLFTAH